MRSETITKLVDALSKAQGEFRHAYKSKENEFYAKNGKTSPYSDLADCIDACKETLCKYGLAVNHVSDIQDGKLILISTLWHTSGEYITSTLPLNPMKPDPQGIVSCMTYMKRAAFTALTGIASSEKPDKNEEDDDDDGNYASGHTHTHTPGSRPDVSPSVSPNPLPKPAVIISPSKPVPQKVVDAVTNSLDWSAIHKLRVELEISMSDFQNSCESLKIGGRDFAQYTPEQRQKVWSLLQEEKSARALTPKPVKPVEQPWMNEFPHERDLP